MTHTVAKFVMELTLLSVDMLDFLPSEVLLCAFLFSEAHSDVPFYLCADWSECTVDCAAAVAS